MCFDVDGKTIKHSRGFNWDGKIETLPWGLLFFHYNKMENMVVCKDE